jgi:hypothetical protein
LHGVSAPQEGAKPDDRDQLLAKDPSRLRPPEDTCDELAGHNTRNERMVGVTVFNAGLKYGIKEREIMETARKITVEVPLELLKKAQRASGNGITQTVRTGLQLVAASRTYARLRQLRGKVRFTRTLAELKADR